MEKTLLRTFDVNKNDKAWLAGADKNQTTRLSKVRKQAVDVHMDAVRQRVKMREEGVLIGREWQDAQRRLAEAEEMEEKLKREREEFEREKAAFRKITAAGGSVGTEHVGGGNTSTCGIGGEVGEDTTGGKVESDSDEMIPLPFNYDI